MKDGCVPIKNYIHNKASGQIWPMSTNSLIPTIDASGRFRDVYSLNQPKDTTGS
jgi:hypothetical protein